MTGATALRRCDLDLAASAVRVRSAYAERSTGELVLGPPKSKAARRIIGIPSSIIPAVREHLSIFVGPEAEALIFPGVKGGPLRRSNFNKMAAWPHAVHAIGAAGMHFHDYADVRVMPTSPRTSCSSGVKAWKLS